MQEKAAKVSGPNKEELQEPTAHWVHWQQVGDVIKLSMSESQDLWSLQHNIIKSCPIQKMQDLHILLRQNV